MPSKKEGKPLEKVDVSTKKVGAALVVGGGVGGMQAALDLADSGIKVYLTDTKPSIGGVMAQLDKTFPTLDCAMCTMAPRLVAIGRHKDIEIITLADVEAIEGQAGNFDVTLKKKPRFVNEDLCTGCGTCVDNCPVHYRIYTRPEKKPEIELDPEDLRKAEMIVEEYREEKGALVAILQSINSAFNYLPENILRYVSAELDIPLTLMYRTATFYNAFSLKPVGKKTITVCVGTACHVKGATRIVDNLESELGIEDGETTEDMNFTLKTVNCLGCCGLAPVTTIGEDLYGKVEPVNIREIIEKYREVGVS
jgi:NADH:ubiquinone oxidoreductase subunit E